MPKTLVLTLLLLSIPIIFNILLRKQIQKQGIPKIKYPYKKKKFLLDLDEKRFFHALSLAIESKNYHIFPKVHLKEFLKVEDLDKRTIYKDKLKNRKVDFLLCHKDTLSPQIAINLERVNKNQASGAGGDMFLDKTFEAAGIKLLKFNIKSEYNIENIREELSQEN